MPVALREGIPLWKVPMWHNERGIPLLLVRPGWELGCVRILRFLQGAIKWRRLYKTVFGVRTSGQAIDAREQYCRLRAKTKLHPGRLLRGRAANSLVVFMEASV